MIRALWRARLILVIEFQAEWTITVRSYFNDRHTSRQYQDLVLIRKSIFYCFLTCESFTDSGNRVRWIFFCQIWECLKVAVFLNVGQFDSMEQSTLLQRSAIRISILRTVPDKQNNWLLPIILKLNISCTNFARSVEQKMLEPFFMRFSTYRFSKYWEKEFKSLKRLMFQ